VDICRERFTRFGKEYFKGGEYESYGELEDETKDWYSEVLSLTGIESVEVVEGTRSLQGLFAGAEALRKCSRPE